MFFTSMQRRVMTIFFSAGLVELGLIPWKALSWVWMFTGVLLWGMSSKFVHCSVVWPLFVFFGVPYISPVLAVHSFKQFHHLVLSSTNVAWHQAEMGGSKHHPTDGIRYRPALAGRLILYQLYCARYVRSSHVSHPAQLSALISPDAVQYHLHTRGHRALPYD
jgi:hypothetical protein